MVDVIKLDKIFIQTIEAEWLKEQHVCLDILRTDVLHPVISGNKWFKLRYYLEEALSYGNKHITTFGGAYSNHIIATACACKQLGLACTGIIRGERPSILSSTLAYAQTFGMQLQFVSRETYKNKAAIAMQLFDTYIIQEGGYGKQGARGAAAIMDYCPNPNQYTHIICAVGTGTMLAGIIKSAAATQTVIGISVMKANMALENELAQLMEKEDRQKQYSILHDYHFGGYAKHPPALIAYMNTIWQAHQIPTDIVYTSKTFFAAETLIRNNTISPGSRVLMIHSGGLQGNLSLPPGVLLF
jgi:1-aminocyclopropane-1-carboxylate deaminase